MADGGRFATGFAIVGFLVLILGYTYMQENAYTLEDVTFNQVKSDAIEAFLNIDDLSIGQIQAYATDKIREIALTDEFGNKVAVYLPPSPPIDTSAFDQFGISDYMIQLSEAYDILKTYPEIGLLLPDFIDFDEWIKEPENQELLIRNDIFIHEKKLQKFEIDNPSYGIGSVADGTVGEVTTKISSGGLGTDWKYRLLSNNNPSGLPLVYIGEAIVVAGKIKMVDPTCTEDCPQYVRTFHYWRGEFTKIDGTPEGKFLYATPARMKTSLNGDWDVKIQTGYKTPFHSLGTYQLKINTATADEPPRPFIFTVQFQIVQDPSRLVE